MATVSLCESCRSGYPESMEGDDNYSTTRPCDDCGYVGRDLTNTFTLPEIDLAERARVIQAWRDAGIDPERVHGGHLPERHSVGDTLTILTQSYYSGGN